MAGLFTTAAIPSPVSAAIIGSVEMSGDPGFDSDSVANSDTNQYRWLSYPGARFSLNPSPSVANSQPGPMASNLPLNIGGFLYNGTKNISNVVNVQMSTTGGGANDANTVGTTWYPYKITFDAAYNTPGGVSISGYDFFADANSSIIRVIQVNGSTGKDLILSGTIPWGTSGAQWDSTNKVLVVTDSLYYSALRFVALSGSGLTSSDITQTPTISGNTWTLRIPLGTTSGNYYGISYAYAANTEGMSAAVSRARNCFSQGVTTTLANTKNVFDTYLRKAPKPSSFGIWSGINSLGVTADQHRKAYYGAWTFLLTNYMNVLPENASTFNYKQVLCGKPSLWANGADYNKGSCAWESFLGQQWLSYIMPEEAWNAYKGTMSMVDSTGYLPGEVLPSRKAQTAWVVYKNGGCSSSELAALYPTIKRYLLWLENNPRWIYGSHNYSDEKDMEFCASFIYDCDFAIKIANEVGQTADVSMWQSKQSSMTDSIRTLFMSDPNKLYQINFTNTGAYYYADRTSDIPESVLNAIIVSGLTSNENTRLITYFRTQQNSNNGCDGLFYKYPVASIDVYGMLNKGFKSDAKQFISCIIRDTVRMGNFSENINNTPSMDGVQPSIFSAAGLIDFTLIDNGCSTYTGTPTAIDWSGVTLVAQVYYKIKNSWTGKYLNIENNTGKVECGNLGGDWGTAKWILEDAGLGNFRIKNMWTNQYLHIENNLGYVQYGTLGGDWASAKWKLVDAGGYVQINNVWKSDQYIHVENSLGYAESSSLGGDWGTAKWVLVPVSTDDATFYQNSNYGGTSVTLAKGNYTLSQLNALGIPNDWVSSIKVPVGWTVEIYQNDNFGGTKWTFTSDSSYVGGVCNDQMSSVKIY